jgi:hypothetical protein
VCFRLTLFAPPQAPPPGHCFVCWLKEPLPEEEDEPEAVPFEALRVRDRGTQPSQLADLAALSAPNC